MDNIKKVVNALVLEKFNECVQAGAAQSTIEANISYISDLILNATPSADIVAYIDEKKVRLVADKAALAKQKLDAEAQYDGLIKVLDDGKGEL